MRVYASLLATVFAVSVAEGADTLAITNVTVVDVEDGRSRAARTVLIEAGRIRSVTESGSAHLPRGTTIVDGSGRFLVPGFWDMHVHSHRDQRWTYQHPLFVAHGVTGVRDAGTHLASALAWMQASSPDTVAPTVIWGSPPLDGPVPVLSFALGVESPAAADPVVELLRRSGFDFIKTYDRLPADTYRALARAAERADLRLEGHVPLGLSPSEAVAAGHDLIDHLTLVVESCSPGALERVHSQFHAGPDDADSMALLMDPAMAALLEGYDAATCRDLFATFARHSVWQVPTLVQLRGFVLPAESARLTSARTADAPPAVMAQWQAAAEEIDGRSLAAGAAMYRRQMALLRPMQDAGVRLLVGTDTSNEPWVFAGSSVHDEMALFVEAGLTPLEALQAATSSPLQYVGRARGGKAIDEGEVADLVLLDADPRIDIAATRTIRAVVLRGRLFDREALDQLQADAHTVTRGDSKQSD